MNLKFWVQVAALLSVMVTMGGLVITINRYRKQINASLFTTYTKRYDEIMQSFPDSLDIRLGTEEDLPEPNRELRRSILRYLNLCSEEYYLKESGYLDEGIWNIWKKELIRTLRSPLLRREWPNLRNEFEAYPEFRNFIDRVQE